MTKLAQTALALQALLGALVLLGWVVLTVDQIAGIMTFVNAAFAAVWAWLDPSVPIGRTDA